jgi:hypothetical protein
VQLSSVESGHISGCISLGINGAVRNNGTLAPAGRGK